MVMIDWPFNQVDGSYYMHKIDILIDVSACLELGDAFCFLLSCISLGNNRKQ